MIVTISTGVDKDGNSDPTPTKLLFNGFEQTISLDTVLINFDKVESIITASIGALSGRKGVEYRGKIVSFSIELDVQRKVDGLQTRL